MHDRLPVRIEQYVVIVIDVDGNAARRRPLLGILPLHEGAAIAREVVHPLRGADEKAVDAALRHACPNPIQAVRILRGRNCRLGFWVQTVEHRVALRQTIHLPSCPGSVRLPNFL